MKCTTSPVQQTSMHIDNIQHGDASNLYAICSSTLMNALSKPSACAPPRLRYVLLHSRKVPRRYGHRRHWTDVISFNSHVGVPDMVLGHIGCSWSMYMYSFLSSQSALTRGTRISSGINEHIGESITFSSFYLDRRAFKVWTS